MPIQWPCQNVGMAENEAVNVERVVAEAVVAAAAVVEVAAVAVVVAAVAVAAEAVVAVVAEATIGVVNLTTAKCEYTVIALNSYMRKSLLYHQFKVVH